MVCLAVALDYLEIVWVLGVLGLVLVLALEVLIQALFLQFKVHGLVLSEMRYVL